MQFPKLDFINANQEMELRKAKQRILFADQANGIAALYAIKPENQTLIREWLLDGKEVKTR